MNADINNDRDREMHGFTQAAWIETKLLQMNRAAVAYPSLILMLNKWNLQRNIRSMRLILTSYTFDLTWGHIFFPITFPEAY